jgi:hypothetical protein
MTVGTIASPATTPTLRIIGVDLSLRMVVAPIGHTGKGFRRIVIVSGVVDQYPDTSPDTTRALTVAEEIVVVVPFTIDQHPHTKISTTLTGDP